MSLIDTTETNWRLLCDLAVEKRDACAKSVGVAQHAVVEARSKLEMLIGYQRDYVSRMSEAGAGGIAAERLQNFRRFLAHLERAVEQQREVVRVAESKMTDAQLALRVAQRSVESFNVLIERGRKVVDLRQRRDQQKQQDEFASRALPRFLTGAD